MGFVYIYANGSSLDLDVENKQFQQLQVIEENVEKKEKRKKRDREQKEARGILSSILY